MKKSKLLIPALSIASVGAVVAPIVTSCNSNAAATLELDISKIEEWIPSGEQLTGAYTEEEMTAKYYEFIKSNPKYLAEDVVYGLFGSSVNPLPATGSIKIWINNIDSTNHAVSLRVEVVGEGEVGTGVTGKMTRIIDITNIPYVVDYDEGFELAPVWTEETIITAKDWSFHFSESVEALGSKSVEELYADNNSPEAAKKEVWDQLGYYESYYMAKCTLKP